MPEIPPNTGNIARLCVAIGAKLHIIGKPSFDLSEKAVRRAGLDYWDDLELVLHPDWSECKKEVPDLSRIFLITKFGSKNYTEESFKEGDFFVFGRETSGLPPEILSDIPEFQHLKIPMLAVSRSLNLSNAAAVVAYEAIRQLGL